MADNPDQAHETQNFVKNLGIFAGLIILSTTHRVSQWGFFQSTATKKD